MKHIIASQQFSKEWLEQHFFPLAEKMGNFLVRTALASEFEAVQQEMRKKAIISLFYEPSTRTRSSFEIAAQNIGGRVIVHTENAKEFSSAIKGETLEDTIRVMSSLCLPYENHAIVLRHHQTGAAAKAAEVSNVPIINAGDGEGQHPTQALLDIFTIWQEFHHISGMKVAMVGDLLRGRTVRSLCYLLSKFPDVHIYFVAPEQLKMRQDIKDHLNEHGVSFTEHNDLHEVATLADVIYATRVQRERPGEEDVAYDAGKFSISDSVLELLPRHGIVMHPLPRNPQDGELPPSVDYHRSARYFAQAQNGLFVRMALLYMIFSPNKSSLLRPKEQPHNIKTPLATSPAVFIF